MKIGTPGRGQIEVSEKTAAILRAFERRKRISFTIDGVNYSGHLEAVYVSAAKHKHRQHEELREITALRIIAVERER